MRPISLVRFDALAGYARMPMARAAAEELAWFEYADGRVVGALIRDRADGDFGGVVFAQDKRLRFRATNVTQFEEVRRRAEVALRRAMEQAAMAPPEEHYQGDEKAPPVDFFAFTRPHEQLNRDFLSSAELEGYSAGRQIIEPMMRWFDDADGNFIEQFQTTGFNQRIWELYLFAAFTEMGYVLDRRHPIPDFMLDGPFGEVAVEAVTVGPTRGGNMAPPPTLDTREGAIAYLRQYMPIKFGSALFSKLQKKYWEQPNVAGKPLALAIEDFSSPGSMIGSRSALDVYLYGYEHDWAHSDTGRLNITPRKIAEHRWGRKVIPAGFFDQPEAEHVSAVLFSNSGTIAKFNRMGVIAGFGSPRVLVVRQGTAVNHDPDAAVPHTFRHVVNAQTYRESWVEGLDVFHNPRALCPLDERSLPGAAHHYLTPDGHRLSRTPDWHPLASITNHFVPVDVEMILAQLAAGEPVRPDHC